jgi:F-type H+-transporting ATPase subunit delta
MPTDRLQDRKAAGVYAATLFEAAQATDAVFVVADELDDLYAALIVNFRLREALSNPALSAAGRRALATELFGEYNAALLAVFGVMLERGDLRLLAKLREAYTERVEEALGVVIIEVTTAVALDEALREVIRTKYAAQFGAEVVLRERLDASLLGGIVLSAHGKRIDASVASQLERARVALSDRR